MRLRGLTTLGIATLYARAAVHGAGYVDACHEHERAVTRRVTRTAVPSQLE